MKYIFAIALAILLTSCTAPATAQVEPKPPAAIGVTITVNNVDTKPEKYAPAGYVGLAVNVTIDNHDRPYVDPIGDIVVVDKMGNSYKGTYATNHDAGTSPDIVLQGKSTTGTLYFVVPRPALQTDLRLIWQTGQLTKMIDVYLGPIKDTTQSSERSW